jgi:granule-bound starch synthase
MLPAQQAAPVARRLSQRVAVKAAARAITTGALGTQMAMNIVFVSAEVAPWSKTGGLGDVVGGLPIELAKRGHKVITIAPR